MKFVQATTKATKWISFLAISITMLWASSVLAKSNKATQKKAKSFYDFTVKSIDGKKVALSKYRGKVLLIVNTASRCGYTPQYADLQKLYAKYKSKGLVVLGFPANNFGGQEPGSNKQIKSFCSSKFHVTFPLFAKVSVKGAKQHPLFAHLTQKKGAISWNFNKFLISKTGAVAAKFESSDEPLGKKIVGAVSKHLK